jgi:hypothetical protein
MKILLLLLLGLHDAVIRCDYDGQIASLWRSVVMRDGHVICDLHQRFDSKGQLVCPLDNSKGKR